MLDLSMELAAARAILGELHLENDELRAGLTDLRERMRWRDAAKELPDEYEDVLVVLIQDSTGARFVVEAYMHRDIDGVVWWRRNGQVVPDPEFWQPLPAAPEVPQ